MISDGLRSGHGVEEVVTISILQKILQDNQAKAKLVTLDSVEWNTTFGNNPMRKLMHEKKMASKFERAEGQMSHLFNVDAGVVEVGVDAGVVVSGVDAGVVIKLFVESL